MRSISLACLLGLLSGAIGSPATGAELLAREGNAIYFADDQPPMSFFYKTDRPSDKNWIGVWKADSPQPGVTGDDGYVASVYVPKSRGQVQLKPPNCLKAGKFRAYLIHTIDSGPRWALAKTDEFEVKTDQNCGNTNDDTSNDDTSHHDTTCSSLIDNPTFNTGLGVPATGRVLHYVPGWENHGIVISNALGVTGNAVAPYTQYRGYPRAYISTTIDVVPGKRVTVTYKARGSKGVYYCLGSSEKLKVAASGFGGKVYTIRSTDTTFDTYSYSFTPDSSTTTLEFSAPESPYPLSCGPFITDVQVDQEGRRCGS